MGPGEWCTSPPAATPPQQTTGPRKAAGEWVRRTVGAKRPRRDGTQKLAKNILQKNSEEVEGREIKMKEDPSYCEPLPRQTPPLTPVPPSCPPPTTTRPHT